jgi:hypothetical protein
MVAEELQELLLTWEEELMWREEVLAAWEEKVGISEKALAKVNANLAAEQAKAEATRQEYLNKMAAHTSRAKHSLGLDKMIREKKVELDGMERDLDLRVVALTEVMDFIDVAEPPWRGSSSTKINLSDSRWSENTINTNKYNTTYWSLSISYYKLGSRFKYTKGLRSKDASKDSFRVCGSRNTLVQNILFTQEENAIHQHSKHEDPSMVSNPHRFGPPTDNPHRHRQKEEEAPHLHTGDNKSKAWATMLNKTYQ